MNKEHHFKFVWRKRVLERAVGEVTEAEGVVSLNPREAFQPGVVSASNRT